MICNNNNIITNIFCTCYFGEDYLVVKTWTPDMDNMTYKMTSLKGEWIYVSYCLSDHVLTSRASVDIINI